MYICIYILDLRHVENTKYIIRISIRQFVIFHFAINLHHLQFIISNTKNINHVRKLCKIVIYIYIYITIAIYMYIDCLSRCPYYVRERTRDST